MNSDALLTRLSQPGPQGPLDKLAAQVVDDLLARPVESLLPPSLVARAVTQCVRGWVESEAAGPALAAWATDAAAALRGDDRLAGDVLPKPLRALGRELVGRPYSPARSLVLLVLDRAPVRELLRGLLLDAVLEFGEKLKSPVADNSVARGIGGIARFAAEQAKTRTGALGAFATGVVGAVSSEVEKQLERRAREFVDLALGNAIGQLADELSNPARAREQGELRGALLEGALEVPMARLGVELAKLDLPGGAERARVALSSWLAQPDTGAQLEQAARALLRRDGGRPLGEVLADHGQREVLRALAVESLAERMRAFVATPGFARWLSELVA